MDSVGNLQAGRRTANFDPSRVMMVIVSLVVGYLVVIPLVSLIYTSFKDPTGALTLTNYVNAFGEGKLYSLMLTSFIYALGSASVATVVAAGVAWLVERTNVAGKHLFFALALGPLVIPGMLNTVAWIFLLSPKIGLLNVIATNWLGFTAPPFNIYSLGGMIWTEGIHISPLAFMLISANLRSLDPSLEEAARMSGASPWQAFFRITFRLSLPAFLSGFLLMFIRGFESFEVPAVIGLPAEVHVFMSRIYLALHSYPPDYGYATTLSMVILVITGLGVYWYNRYTAASSRFATVTGKGYRPSVLDLGKWRYPAAIILGIFFLLVVGLPLFILAWASIIPYFTVPSAEMLSKLTLENYQFIINYPLMSTAVKNSIILSLSAATITMLLTAVIAWLVVRSKARGKWLLDGLASAPLAFPGMVLAVALLTLYLALPLPLYGTLGILIIAYVTKYTPYGMRYVSASMIQIHNELEEAAQVAGSSWIAMFWRILLPLLRPGLLAGWIYIITVSIRELSASVLLYSSGSEVLPVLLFDMWNGGFSNEVSALGIMMITGILALSYGAQKVSARYGTVTE